MSLSHSRAKSSTVFDALGPAAAETFTRRGTVAESCGLLFDAHGSGLKAGLQKRLVAAETFTRRGTVAESCGLLFDAHGNGLKAGLQKRLVAATETQLRNVKEVVALATEPERVDAVRAITRSGRVTTLVTDRIVAERLLQ